MDTNLILKEEDRQKLDGIVQQMIVNKEPDSNIRFVVDDFKKIYGVEQEQPKKSLIPGADLPKPTARGLVLGVAKTLPTAGAIAGGFGGTVLGTHVGGIAGAGIGATAGTAVKNLIDQTIGDKQVTATEAITEPLKAGAKTYIGSKIISKGAELIAPTIKKAGDIAYRTTIRPDQRIATMLKDFRAKYSLPERVVAAVKGKTLTGDPITPAETAARKGLVGTESMIGVQAKRASDAVFKKILNPAFETAKKAGEKVDMKVFVKEIGEEISKIEDPIRRDVLLEGFKPFSKAIGKLGKIDLDKLQNLKVDWAEFLPKAALKGQDVAAPLSQIRNLASQKARDYLYTKLGQFNPLAKEAYLDYGNLQALQSMGVKAIQGQLITGGTGTTLRNVLDMTITPVSTIAGKTLYTAGKGLEFVGKAGAGTIGEALGI